MRSLLAGLLLAAAVPPLPALAAEPGPSEPAPAAAATSLSPGDAVLLAAVEDHLASERAGTAAVLCEERGLRAADEPLPLVLRAACARAYLALGDKLASMGAESARRRWEHAADLDPRLLDDPGFAARMETGLPPGGEPPPRTPGGEPPPEHHEHVAPSAPSAPEEPRPDAGHRSGRALGLGLGYGYDGAGSLVITWMSQGHLSIEASVGLLYPVVDLRARWFGLTTDLSPVLGLGMTIPFDREGRFGASIGGFDALYALGESVHVDIGLSWAPTRHLDLFGGVAFVTPLDQDHPDTVLFFPQLALQALWYF